MIKTPTVFVLGAGASIPYGYPSGEELRNKIIDELNHETQNCFQELTNNQGFSVKEVKEFKDSFFYSGKSSIDAFLEYRTEYIDIGKLAIAMILIPNEYLNRLFTTGNGKWYSYFYNRLSTSFDDFDSNKFSIITFNYDRSFEQFLFTALKNSYGKSDNECASKLDKIPIIHLHGILDDLNWKVKDGRPYDSSKRDGEFLKKSAEKIKIIHEDIDGNKSFKDAHDLLEKSENIHFIGFGYNKTNIKRLRIPKNKPIRGTALKMTPTEQEECRKLLPGIALHGHDGYNYVRNNVNFE